MWGSELGEFAPETRKPLSQVQPDVVTFSAALSACVPGLLHTNSMLFYAFDSGVECDQRDFWALDLRQRRPS